MPNPNANNNPAPTPTPAPAVAPADPGNGNGNGNGNGGGQPPNPGNGHAHANPAQANAALEKLAIAFGKDFRRKDGTVFRIVTDAITDFQVILDTNDGDAIALFLENPIQLLLAQIYALHQRVQELEHHQP